MSEVEIFHARNGATARWWNLPSVDRDLGVSLVIFPALGVPARKYERVAEAFVQRGVAVVLGDYRGQEHSKRPVGRRDPAGYPEMALEDMSEILQEVQRRDSQRKIVVLGHSIGGQGVAVLETLRPGGFAGLVLVAAGTAWWRNYSGKDRFVLSILGTTFIDLQALLLGHLPAGPHGFGRQGYGLMRQWARWARIGSWDGVKRERSQRKFPLLAVNMGGDPYAPWAATGDLLSYFPQAEVVRDAVAEPPGHSQWLRKPDLVVERVAHWLANDFLGTTCTKM